MLQGQKEPRIPKRFLVQISSVREPIVSELSPTENVSPFGARVTTNRSWTPDTRVLVKSSERDLWARARVVHCQPLGGKAFAVGLEFLARTGEWIMGKLWESSGEGQ